MNDDPTGLYARLGVDSAATPEAITAAFRRKARVLHPDIVGTGDAEAFLLVKEAYDVLGHAQRRAAYDRAARAAFIPQPAVSPAAEPVVRGPRLSDLPVALSVVLGGLLCLAVVMAVFQLNRPPRTLPAVTASVAPALPQTPRPAASPVPTVVPATDTPTHYVVPAVGTAVLWRHDPTHDAYLPSGQVPAFSPVQALRLVPQHGLVEIRLADGDSGFVDAARLTPGDAAAAHRAFCAYDAGVSPSNGEVLDRHGGGPARLAIENHGDQPAVVKLRDAAGFATATVFIAPASSATVTDLPDRRYRVEFAVGQLWSRVCSGFAVGMRAQRLPDDAMLWALSPLAIPPNSSDAAPPEDIPDAAFERD